MKAGAHWSLAPAAHAEVAHHMHPSLNQSSFWAWVFRCYVLAPFSSKYGTEQLGRPPYEPREPSIESDEDQSFA